MFFLLNTASVTGKAEGVEYDETNPNGKTHKQSVFWSVLHVFVPFEKVFNLLLYYRLNRKNLEYIKSYRF
jgi:hypothetical protein